MSEERTMIDWFDEVYTICKDIPLDRLRELAEAERENRLTVYKYPNCYHCPRLPKTNIWQDGDPCKSCRDRALAEKGDADGK